MTEYLSEAVVLAKIPNGDMDARIALFTKKFGKITAKAKSIRKITSKLSGHLEPGNMVRARIVEKSGLQIVDALKQGALRASPVELQELAFLLPEFEPEPHLWHVLMAHGVAWRHILRILGWDPAFAECESCGGNTPVFFSKTRQAFSCETCASRHGRDALLYIGAHQA